MSHRIRRLFLGLPIVLLILGPLTSARSAHAATWPIEQRGAGGANVVAIQYLLDGRGYKLSPDGVFGPLTARAVGRFQTAHHLSADGVVGPLTWPRLVVAVHNGSVGDAVRALQDELVARRVAALRVDGAFGPATYAAVLRFQQTRGLRATGAADVYTWQALISGVPARPVARPVAPAPAAALVVTPSAINRGGIVVVSGAGFARNETVVLLVSGTRAAVAARADAHGLLPATGVAIPYALATGTHTITAIGERSKRRATATITVQQVTPTISLSAPAVTPGGGETVTGRGFAVRERVTLSLDGEALATTPSPIITSNGAFTARFKAPSSLRRGANTVSAIGNQSRVSAAVALTGILVSRTQAYMAGGLNTASESSNVIILNTNRASTRVDLIFYFDNGARIPKTVVVPAHSSQLYVGSALGLPQGTFGVEVRADRPVASALTVNRYNHTDDDAIAGAAGLSAHWYLAAGSTNGGTETLSILNTNSSRAANVQLQVLGATSGARRVVTVTIPPHTTGVTNLNTLIPNQDVSVVALSDIPVLVERTQTFGPGASGLTTSAGATAPAVEWLFAAGTTANGVRTEYTALNPGDAPALVTASFYAQDGGALGSQTVSVAPRSRATINLGATTQGDRIAAVVTSDQAVVVEREEYTGTFASAKSGSVTFGRNGTGTRWDFPSGDTTPGVNEALVLFNPSAVTIAVTATFYDSAGRVVTRHITVAPTAHNEISVNTLGLAPQHGAVLRSAHGLGFIAEQGVTTGDGSQFRSTQGLAQ